MWYQNSFLLDPTDRRTMYTKGEKYILNITNFQTSDFGNYRWADRENWLQAISVWFAIDSAENSRDSQFI